MFNINKALSIGDCDNAISLANVYYNSPQSDNTVRRARASSYACSANVNFFAITQALTTHSVIGSALWRTLTEIFPSTVADKRMESSWIAAETLMTWLKPNMIIPPEYATPTGAYNPGSIIFNDRDNNAGIFTLYVSMALVGATNNRYGIAAGQSFPASYNKQQPLPWSTATLVAEDPTGCAYAGGVMSIFDAVQDIGTIAGPPLSNSLSQISQLKAAYDQACNAACQGLDAVASGLGIDFSTLGCDMTASEAAALCAVCPAKLRHRSMCVDTTVPIDKNPVACAAAGVINMINNHPIVGWPGP